MTFAVTIASFFLIFVAYLMSALGLIRYQKRKRQLEPPEQFVLLRAPGETLRRNDDVLAEKMMDWLVLGSLAAFVLLGSPLAVLIVVPSANQFLLLGASLTLFVAASIVVLRRIASLASQRRNAHQGYLGERRIAEHLQGVIASGFRLFHDVPLSLGDRMANIDHVAIGPQGAVVVETKTYSKPTHHKGSPLRVVFDGERITWPRCPNDTKTLWQVKKNAEWLQEYIRQHCQITVPVAQVVAIPGWDVREKVLTVPRVVRGSGVADAVLHAIQASRPALLSPAQIRDVSAALERLCRDVKD
jgi:hypothetical protein